MKKAILMGQSGCGKTTLIQALEHQALRYRKTQVVEHSLHFIDTPGEYLERRNLYRALIVTAVDADVVGLVQPCDTELVWVPPSFASTFSKPVFGLVTKTDLMADADQLARARGILERGGASPIFEVSAVEGTGLDALMAYLEMTPPDAQAHAPAPEAQAVRA
jgi:ethanolamine utilization protein EutP